MSKNEISPKPEHFDDPYVVQLIAQLADYQEFMEDLEKARDPHEAWGIIRAKLYGADNGK